MVRKKKIIICVRVGLKTPSLGITICQYSASLVMPNGGPWDGFFYPTHILLMDSCIIYQNLSNIDSSKLL